MYWIVYRDRVKEGVAELRSIDGHYWWYVTSDNIDDIRENIEKIFYMDDMGAERFEGLEMLDMIEREMFEE